MLIQLPGSVLSRALRSRLIRQRLVNTTTHRFGRGVTSNALRLYSTAKPAAHRTRPNHGHETSPRPTPPVHDVDTSGQREGVRGSSDKYKEERTFLMAIASNLSPHVDADVPRESPGFATNSRRAIMKELEWLKDPRALADRVGRLLQSGDPVMAVALVRQAQKKGDRLEVAWNNILQYCMDRQFHHVAFKFYNDMKKRGGKPNSRTYTIMFKGFSTAWKTTGIFHPALSVYRSLFAKNTTVVPNIIHTNAMLLVCRRQVNMEMLWRIVGDLPEEGPQAPDMTTYTTILGAIQFAARREIRDIRIMYSGTDQFDRVLKRKEQMIKEGKRIWADVLYRWTKGQLPLDNQVVNAMARLLVDGVYDRDYYDVFALYHQTMGIPILGETHPENSKFIHRRVMRVGPEPAQAMDVPFVHEVDEDNKLLRRDKKETSVEDEEEENFDSLFDPVIPKFEQLSYLKPGNQELTLLLDACLNKTQGASAGTAYWDHLTRESSSHRVEPDRVSFLQYLRLLRVTRSSKLAARVIREQIIPSGNEDGKAFHIALSCCRRDRRNLQVFNHANLLLDLMHETLMLPDTRVLEGYLHLIRAFSHNPHVLLYLGGIEMEKDERDRTENKTLRRLGHKLQANLRLRALETLRPHFNKLHEAMNHGKPGPKARQGSVVERNGATFGLPCVKIMSQIRTLIDETLFYKESIPLGQRMILERESKMLRMYSEKATIRKFTSQLVSPTIEQRNQFRERQATIRKKLSERINGKPPKVKESSPENEDREADKPEAQAESSAQQAAKH